MINLIYFGVVLEQLKVADRIIFFVGHFSTEKVITILYYQDKKIMQINITRLMSFKFEIKLIKFNT